MQHSIGGIDETDVFQLSLQYALPVKLVKQGDGYQVSPTVATPRLALKSLSTG